MQYKMTVIWFTITISACFTTSAAAQEEKMLTFSGASDASAAVEIDANTFIVADDEDNILRSYHLNSPGIAGAKYDLTSFLSVDLKHPETDIEGAARVGNRIYWITSHGRNKDGKMRSSRYRFFATDIVRVQGEITITPVGAACMTLANQLVAAEFAGKLGLDKATRFDDLGMSKKKLKELAPKKNGLNIEGLCASADGSKMYLGLRNPQHKDKKSGIDMAIVIPLENPCAIIEKNDKAIFGKPLLWNFENRGVRSMEYIEYHKAYYIIAGPHDGEKNFAIYLWHGNVKMPPVLLMEIDTENFTPEALTTGGDEGQLLILSDDGTVPIKVDKPGQCKLGELLEDGSCPNKYLVDNSKKTFKAMLTQDCKHKWTYYSKASSWDEESRQHFLPQPEKGKKWEMVFSDEFNDSELDAEKWIVMGDAPRKAGHWLKECTEVDGKGNLVITTKKVGDIYGTGGVRSKPKFARRFGFYVARLKIENCKGHGPAFWITGGGVGTLGDQGRDGTEIDIFEKFYNDNKIQHALHWDYPELKSASIQIDMAGINDGYHTLAVHWTEDQYVFYVDGKETWRTDHGGVSQVPVNILLTDEIRGWNGKIEEQDLPHNYYVDYVRAYEAVDIE